MMNKYVEALVKKASEATEANNAALFARAARDISDVIAVWDKPDETEEDDD